MNPKHVGLLFCPRCGEALQLRDAVERGGRIRSGLLACKQQHTFPVIDFIPRFVDPGNYASNFSSQWNNWPELLSLYDGYGERFKNETKWPDDLTGALVLEAGCGAGTFTPFAAATGATVVSFDLSRGVEANYERSGHLENVLIVQADIFSIPVRKHSFDYVFCFGVLQHTPNPKAAFMSLSRCLSDGGQISVDVYTMPPEGHPYEILWKNKYRARRFINFLPEKIILRLVKTYVHLMWPLVKRVAAKETDRARKFNRTLLFDDYKPRLPGMDPARYKSFAMLDIYDFLGPAYDIPATWEELKSWFEEAMLSDIDVHPGYNGLEGRGIMNRDHGVDRHGN